MVGDENPNREKGALERARSGVSIRYELIAITPVPPSRRERGPRTELWMWESGLKIVHQYQTSLLA